VRCRGTPVSKNGVTADQNGFETARVDSVWSVHWKRISFSSRKNGENIALGPSIQAGIALMRSFTSSVSAAICRISRVVRVGAQGICHA
jgi:hypothetical protein